MTLQDIKKEISAEFDEQFGKPVPDQDGDLFHEGSEGETAGCDDCYANQEERQKHKDFLLHSIDKSIQRFRENTAVEKVAGGNYNCGEEGCCNPNPDDKKELEDFQWQIGFNEALRLKSEREDNFIRG